jgi:transcriptional regulator with PAS, ATPase and Fis domain
MSGSRHSFSAPSWDDIPRLVHYLVDTFNTEFRKRVRNIGPETPCCLLRATI